MVLMFGRPQPTAAFLVVCGYYRGSSGVVSATGVKFA